MWDRITSLVTLSRRAARKGITMAKLGVLVVGQGPRPEIESELARHLNGVELDLRGCLDGLDAAEIAALAPDGDEPELFTRLPTGASVTLSKREVVRRGESQLDALERSGADVVVMLCTGGFPGWAGRRVLFPDVIFGHFVRGVQPRGHLGVLTPLPSQLADAEARWTGGDHRVTAVALSPNAGKDETAAAGRQLAAAAPDLLVLDCVSYTREMKATLCRATGRPGALAISCIARVVGEVLDTG